MGNARLISSTVVHSETLYFTGLWTYRIGPIPTRRGPPPTSQKGALKAKKTQYPKASGVPKYPETLNPKP